MDINWATWLVPLVALVIWIVLNLFRPPNEEGLPQQRPPARPPRPVHGDRAEAGQHPITDLDRYLQEVQRRRDRSEGREAARPVAPHSAGRRQPEESLEDIPVVQPVHPRGRQTPPPLPRETTPRPGRPVTARPAPEPKPRVRPAAQETRKEAAVRLTTASREAVNLATMQLSAAQNLFIPSAGTGTGGQHTSPAAEGIVELLQDHKSIQAAFALREILDQPVSKRPKRKWY